MSNLFKSLKLLVIPVFSLPVTAVRGEPASDLQAVVESEKRFARTALERGIRDSFLQFFADDSIVFVPEPTNGKAFYTQFKEKGRRLIWRPIFATIAGAGDLGVTTGPWEIQKSATDNEPIAYGEFVSVWKKQADGCWKVVVDIGIDHARTVGPAPEIQLSPGSPKSGSGKDSREALEQAEKEFADGLDTDPRAALLNSASPGIRVFRSESFPAVGQEAASELIAAGHGKMTRQVAGGGTSSAMDLAYRYGPYSWARLSGAAESGYYFTIWQIDAGGDWKIILDLQRKAPQEK